MAEMKIGFLGPQGTFTEEALLAHIDVRGKKLIPCSTEQDVITAVEKGDVNLGIIPIENSIEGTVNATLDTLTFEANLLIEQEIISPIHHSLIAPKGTKLKDIKMIISHPQATAQCRRYLAQKLSGVVIEAANSTAEAVRKVSLQKDKGIAAIGTRLAAELYGLEIVASNIEDFKDNLTRFVLVGRKATKRTGKDKTSIVCFIYADRPGSLLQILQEFAYRHINLTKIQSRPTKKALGEYCFWIDMEGHIEDETVASAIKCLKCKLREVKVLGSYPKADRHKHKV